MIAALHSSSALVAPVIVRRRRLFAVTAAMAVLDVDEDTVLSMCEDGRLYSWNIGLGKRSVELRILPESLDFAAGGWSYAATSDQVLALLVPEPRKAEMLTWEVARTINSSKTHVMNLVQAGALKTDGRGWHVGPNGSAHITTESLIAFLERRRYPAPNG